jgi:hypothetical protein
MALICLAKLVSRGRFVLRGGQVLDPIVLGLGLRLREAKIGGAGVPKFCRRS